MKVRAYEFTSIGHTGPRSEIEGEFDEAKHTFTDSKGIIRKVTRGLQTGQYFVEIWDKSYGFIKPDEKQQLRQQLHEAIQTLNREETDLIFRLAHEQQLARARHPGRNLKQKLVALQVRRKQLHARLQKSFA